MKKNNIFVKIVVILLLVMMILPVGISLIMSLMY